MHITIAAVGKLKQGYYHNLFYDYFEKLSIVGKSAGFTKINLIEVAHASKQIESKMLQKQVAKIAKIHKTKKICLFCQSGRNLSSIEFSQMLQNFMNQNIANWCAIIGGADGVDKKNLGHVDDIISFGKLTLPHQLVRSLVAEQLYRAATILTNHPYHKE